VFFFPQTKGREDWNTTLSADSFFHVLWAFLEPKTFVGCKATGKSLLETIAELSSPDDPRAPCAPCSLFVVFILTSAQTRILIEVGHEIRNRCREMDSFSHSLFLCKPVFTINLSSL
jgi:hypothetical protein